MIFSSHSAVAGLLSAALVPAALAAPEFFVDVGEGGEGAPVTFAHVNLGPEQTVFDTLIHPTQISNFQFSLASNSFIRVVQGTGFDSFISGTSVNTASDLQRFTDDTSAAFLNNNLNHYLGYRTFTFDDTFSYELGFAAPLLDDAPATADELTELFFTSRDDNSYMLIEALEAPGGALIPGSNPFLVDTNGWVPARNTDGGGLVPQLDGTALYVQGVDLSMLGVSQAQYFRLSSVSTNTSGVSDFTANSIASGLSITAIETTAVPEPSAALLALLGLTAFAARRRKA